MVAAAPLLAIAQTPVPAQPAAVAPVPATPTATHAPITHSAKMKKNIQDKRPDTALIEYLGDYEDAADGLDPMGLAAHPEAVPQTGKDGHQQ